jgi:hypothetical protein
MCFRSGAAIHTEPVREIGMARRVVEFDSLLKIVVGAGKVAEMKAGDAGNAVRDQGLGAIGPRHRFAQEKLGHFPHRRGFAAIKVPDPKTEIGGEPIRGVRLSGRNQPSCPVSVIRRPRSRIRRYRRRTGAHVLGSRPGMGSRDDESVAGAPKTAIPAGWAASPLSDYQKLQSFDAVRAQQWLIRR